MLSIIKYLIIVFFAININAQNLGGSYTYAFLKLSNNTTTTALGGALVALQSKDFAISLANPALLKQTHIQHFDFNAQQLNGGIKNLSSTYVFNLRKWNLPLLANIQYINYGKLEQTNEPGNNIGNFTANDFVVSFATSKSYLDKFNFGSTLKLIGNQYGIFKSFALATDVGLNYFDSAKLLQVGFCFKNIGVQLKPLIASENEPLPFDFQIGLSKKLKKAPLQFVVTITNAHQFNIRYADTLFDQSINAGIANKKFTLDKLVRHIIIGTQIAASKQLHFNIGYNYLKRKELGLYNIGNGFSGFSFGVGVNVKAYQFSYANTFYFNNRPFHQIGVQINYKNLVTRK
jgi:hypothetical protein